MLPGFDRFDGPFVVEAVRKGDVNKVDGRIVEERIVRSVVLLEVVLFGVLCCGFCVSGGYSVQDDPTMSLNGMDN